MTLADANIPTDRIIDGLDLSPVLFGTGPSPREVMFYYRGRTLYAVRKGPFKAHFVTEPAYGKGDAVKHDPPLLYNLEQDPSEKYDVSKQYPGVIADIQVEVKEHLQALVPGEDQLAKRIGKN
jgi:arylsulfatase A-like enzyme